jgi:hypothetical protein
MCIAILNTSKAGRLPKKQIQNSWDNNDMGSGLLWNKDGKLNVFKSYDYDDYLEKYNDLRDDKSIGNIVLHFRIATSGYDGEHNLHPFLVNDDLGFVHNGIIKGLGNKTFSDTYEFNDMLKYTIINEGLGKWSGGNWYSNDSYKEYKSYVYYGNKKVSKTEVNGNTYEPKVYDKKSSYSPDYNSIDGWNETPNNELLDEWDMYDYLCDIYALDPNDDASFNDLETFMSLNNVNTLAELYNLISNEYTI